MPDYHVTWEIEVSADNREDAAREAMQIMKDPGHIARTFTVRSAADQAGVGSVVVDLSYECLLCGGAVSAQEMRDHLRSHRLTAPSGLEAEEFAFCFTQRY